MFKKNKKSLGKKLYSFRQKNHKKILATWVIASLLMATSGLELFVFNTPTAKAANSAINFNTESEYSQEDVKDTVAYATVVSGAQINLKTDVAGANVDISAKKIKRGCRVITGGSSYKIIGVNNASTGLVTLASAPLSGTVTNIYCTTFSGSAGGLGTGSMVTASTTSLSNGSGSNHRITYDGTNNRVYVSAVGQNYVKKFSTTTETFATDIAVEHGTYDVAYDATNNVLWASDSGFFNIIKIDSTTSVPLATYPVAGAQHIAFSPTGNKIFFGTGSKVREIPVDTGISSGDITVGTTPRNMAYDSTQNSIWVSNNGSGSISKISASDDSVTGTYSVGAGPDYIAYDVTQNAIWVSNDTDNTVTKVNATNGAVIGTYSVGTGGFHSIAYDSNSNSIWVTNPSANTITQLKASDGSLVGTHNVTGADDIIYDSNTKSLWIYDRSGNNLVRFAGDGPYISGSGYSFTTTSSSRINSTGWSAVNSATVTETNNGSIFYGVSFDGGHTYKIWNGSAWRDIASDLNSIHGGTDGNWYYKSFAGSWMGAGTNSAQGAMDDAIIMGGAPNSMTGTNVNAMTSGNWSASGGWTNSATSIDVAVFTSVSDPTRVTSVDSFSFDYTSTPTIGFTSSAASGTEATSPMTITALLSSTYASDVTAWYTLTGTSTAGTDYTTPSGTVTIPSGSTSALISVPITNDTTKEANETLILTLYNATNATVDNSNRIFTYTINDDDSATVQFSSATTSTPESIGTARIPVTLSAASGQAVTIDYAASDGTASSASDYALTSGTLTIPAGATIGYITPTITNDVDGSPVNEGSETFTITLSNAVNATLGLTLANTISISDSDGYPTAGFTAATSTAPEGSTASISIAASKAPLTGQAISLNYSISGGTGVNGTNFNVASLTGTATITAPATTASISIPTLSDDDSINQTVIVRLTSGTNADLNNITEHTLVIKEATVTSSAPTRPTVNGITTPAAIATTNPVFGWKFNPGVTSDKQTSYQLLIATSESNLSGGTYTCDSTKTASYYSITDYATACSGAVLPTGTYYWKVRTWNSTDTASSYSAVQTLTISGTITAPTSCTTTSITATTLTVGWTDNASNESAFEIEQSGNGGVFPLATNRVYKRITTTAANAISYDVSGLTPGQTYFFRVRAIGNYGTSTDLLCSSAAMLPATPAAPTITTLSSTSLRAIINQPTDLLVYAIQVNGSSYVLANGTLGVSAIYQSADTWAATDIIGLSANTAYSMQIISRNFGNVASSASTPTVAYTSAVQAVVTTGSPAANAFTVTIGAATNPLGTIYAIELNDGTQSRYVQANGALGNTLVQQSAATWGTISLTGLMAATNYRIQIVAYDGNGIPVYSNITTTYTGTGTATSFGVSGLTTISASLSVDNVAATYSFNGGAGSGSVTATATGLSNDGATHNQTVTKDGGTAITMPLCSAVAAPGTPTFQNNQTTSTSLKIFLDTNSNPSNTEYLIQDIATNTYVIPYGTTYGVLASSQSWNTYANLGGASGLTITGLSPGIDHEFRIFARNCQKIDSTASTAARIEIPTNISAAPTVTLTTKNDGTSAANIAINTNSSEPMHAEYAIYDSTTNQYVQSTGSLGASAVWKSYYNWGGTDGYTVYNLSPNVVNVFAVKARKTLAGALTETGFSPVTSITTPPNRPILSSYTVSADTISLQVNPSNNSSNTEYAIELLSGSYLQSGGTNNTFVLGTKSWEKISTWDSLDGSSDGYMTINGLSPNALYTIRLTPRNSGNTEGYQSSALPIYTAAALPTSFSTSVASASRENFSWNVASNPLATEYRITDSGVTQYVNASHALGASSVWSSWDNTVPTNAWYAESLSASTSYCFKIQARNAYAEETAFTATSCGTTTAAAVSSSGGGGGGSTTTPTPTTTISTTPTPVTPTPTTPVPGVATEPTPTPTTTISTTPTPVTPTPTTPVPGVATEPTPTPTTTISTTPTPVTPTPTTPTPTPTVNNTGGGGGFVSDLNDLQKQREEYDRQIKEGYITFLDKKVEIPGAKSFVGITREEFIASLNNDVEYQKAYSAKTAEAIKTEVSTTLQQQASDTYIRTNEAYYAILAALNITEVEACKLHVFEKCDWSSDENYLSEKTRDTLFSNARNYLNDLLTKKTRTLDTDRDGIMDYDEIYLYETNLNSADTDGDGLRDGDEIKKYKTNALNVDTDGDQLRDGDEIKKYKTSPLLIDTDSDRWTDKQEIDAGTDPKNSLSQPEEKETLSGIKDTDGDGVSDLEERNIGTDLNKPDTDGDGVSDSEEVARGTNPLIPDAANKPIETAITNLRSGMKFAESPLVRGSSKANETVIFYARLDPLGQNEIGLKREVGRTEAASNNLFAFQLRPLPDGAYYIQAQDSKPVKITIDSTLKIPAPQIIKINDQEVSQEALERAKAQVEFSTTSRTTVELRTQTGSKVYGIFKSAIGTSTLISDTPSGIVEIRPPEELEIGEHEFIAYSVNEQDNTVSPTISFKFKVTNASGFDSSQFRIKNKDGSGLVSFLRQNTVKPLFTKIFVGIGIVLTIWGLLSLYQRRKKN